MTVENLKYFKLIKLQNIAIEKKREEVHVESEEKNNKTDD